MVFKGEKLYMGRVKRVYYTQIRTQDGFYFKKPEFAPVQEKSTSNPPY